MTSRWLRRTLETKDSDSYSGISSQPSGLSFKSDVSKQTIINFCNLIHQSTQNVKKSAEQHEAVVIDYLSRKCHHGQVSDASEVFSESDESENEGIYSRKTRKYPCLNHPLLKSAREAKRSAERHETFVIESLVSKWTSSQWSSDLSSGIEGSLDGTIDSTERAAHLSHKDLPTYHQSMEQTAKWCEDLPESRDRGMPQQKPKQTAKCCEEAEIYRIMCFSDTVQQVDSSDSSCQRESRESDTVQQVDSSDSSCQRESRERDLPTHHQSIEQMAKWCEELQENRNRSLKTAINPFGLGSYREGSERPKTSPEIKKETHRSGESTEGNQEDWRHVPRVPVLPFNFPRSTEGNQEDWRHVPRVPMLPVGFSRYLPTHHQSMEQMAKWSKEGNQEDWRHVPRVPMLPVGFSRSTEGNQEDRRHVPIMPVHPSHFQRHLTVVVKP